MSIGRSIDRSAAETEDPASPGVHVRRMVAASTSRSQGRRSQDDETIPAWIKAVHQGCETSARPDWEAPTELGHACDNRPVMARVRDQKDGSLDAKVALLAGDAAFEGLDIVEMRLRLDKNLELVARDEGVRAAMIAFERLGNLCPPSKSRTESRLKPGEECEVALVAHRIAVGMEGHAQLVTKDGGEARSHVDRQGRRLTPLGPCHAGVTDARTTRDLPQAEAACAASI